MHVWRYLSSGESGSACEYSGAAQTLELCLAAETPRCWSGKRQCRTILNLLHILVSYWQTTRYNIHDNGGRVGKDEKKNLGCQKRNMTFPRCEIGRGLGMGVTKLLSPRPALLQRKRLVGQSDPLKTTPGSYSRTHLWGKWLPSYLPLNASCQAGSSAGFG